MIRLDKAIAALGHQRVQVLIVSDGLHDDDWPENPVDDLLRSDWPRYHVHSPLPSGSHSVTYQCPEADGRFPGHRNVRIRVEFLVTLR
jgi:hypothetical protein